MTTNPLVSVAGVANHRGTVMDSACRRIESRNAPTPEIGLQWHFKFSEIDKCVRARGADGPQGDIDEKVGR